MQQVAISRDRYRHLLTDAAHLYGRQDAEGVIRNAGSYNRPAEDLGSLLSEAWQIDQHFSALAMAEYLDVLYKHVTEAGLPAVQRERVYNALPSTLNDPKVNDQELISYLRENVFRIRGVELEG